MKNLKTDFLTTLAVKQITENYRDQGGSFSKEVILSKELDELKKFKRPPLRIRKASIDLSEYLYRRVKFIGSIKGYGQVLMLPQGGSSDDEDIHYLKVDLAKDDVELPSLYITGRDRVRGFLDCAKSNVEIEIVARVIKFPNKYGTKQPTLAIHSISSPSKLVDLLETNNNHIKEAKEKLRLADSQLEFIKNELIHICGIKGIEKSQNLERSLRVAIYQALSDGIITNSSAKIHTLLIGPPASGKKLITKAASILNPKYIEVGSGKITLAGLSASTASKDGKFTSTPGAIVKASRGTLACQDFHNISKAQFEQVMGVLSLAMEDGVIVDSTAANRRHEALTSIHLDLNKVSDLKKVKAITFHEDIHGIPINILSRFDYIDEIEPSNERQLEIAQEMYTSSDFKMDDLKKRVVSLRTLIACIRDEYSSVEIGSSELNLMARLHENLFKNVRSQEIPELSSFQTRTVISAQKLSIAIARSHLRQKVSLEDIEEAFSIIQVKYAVLEKLMSGFSANRERLDASIPSKKERQDWLHKRFGGKTVSFIKILKIYCKNFNQTQNSSLKRTLYRDLDTLATKVGNKKFKVQK